MLITIDIDQFSKVKTLFITDNKIPIYIKTMSTLCSGVYNMVQLVDIDIHSHHIDNRIINFRKLESFNKKPGYYQKTALDIVLLLINSPSIGHFDMGYFTEGEMLILMKQSKNMNCRLSFVCEGYYIISKFRFI